MSDDEDDEVDYEREDEVFTMIKNGDVDEVRQWLATIRYMGEETQKQIDKALILAARLGLPEIARVLLEDGRASVLAQYMVMGEGPKTALMWAVDYNHKDVVRMLLRVGGRAQVNVQDQTGWTALIRAARYRDNDMVKLLLREGRADANLRVNSGYTALMLAADRGRAEIVKTLLTESNADVYLERGGWTALMFAAASGHAHVIPLLVEHGHGLDVKDVHSDYFDDNRHAAVLQTLIEYGQAIDINRRDEEGRTALMIAASRGNVAVAHVLLDIGHIDLYERDKNGDTALKLAEEAGHTSLMNLLRIHGA